ncbi:MAG: cell filamentation protein Fic [Deltaproteobacteria bacterium]|nr:MAG: cell filamentation protein Fic [Deltaproteobacteria bacterium]
MQTNNWIWQNREWPEFTFDANELLPKLGTAFQLIGKLEAVSQSISKEERTAAQQCILTDDAIETAAIEGEILQRSSVRSSVRKRLGLPVEKEDWDAHADGLIAVLFDARSPAPAPLTKKKLFSWHAGLFPTGYSGLKRIHVGEYRGKEEMQIVSGTLGKEVVHYVAPPYDRLAEEMNLFLIWANTKSTYHPLIKAGIAHLWFIMIHPFDDGNGRLGRAITDYIMSSHYPSLMQILSFSKHFSLDRKGYYATLEAAGKHSLDITNWLSWFLQTTISAMREAEWVIDRVVMKAQFWQVHQNTSLNQRQQKVINRLLDAGEKFEGGMTTRKYAGMTKCSKVTASRDLADLVHKKILQKTASGGRSTSYEIRT